MKYKIKIQLLFLLMFIFPSIIIAEPIKIEVAAKVITAQIIRSGKENQFSIKNIYNVGDVNLNYFYAAELSPVGFMIVAADNDLPPVIEGLIVDILKPEYASVPFYERNSQFEVYPNPAKEIITIDFTANPDADSFVEIYGMEGKLLRRMPIIQKTTEVNTSTFSSGLYYVKVSCSKIIGTRMLIIELYFCF